MKKHVITLQSGKKLDERAFCNYIKEKIRKTAKELNIKTYSGDIFCLDDAAIEIIYSLMNNPELNEQVKSPKPKIKRSPYLHCSRKELELYSKLKKKNFRFIENKGLKLRIQIMLDKLEIKHPEIKYSIYWAQRTHVKGG